MIKKIFECLYCPEDDEYRVYCDICDNQRIERFFKKYLKLQTRANIIRTREQLHKSFEVHIFEYTNIEIHEIACFDLDGEYTLYCDNCNKTNKPKSENKHFKSLYHREYEKHFQINHIFQNPNFSDIDKIYKDFFTIHNKNSKYIMLNMILN